MIRRHESPIIQVVCSVLIPFIQMFALYVVVHGHYGPGNHLRGNEVRAIRRRLGRHIQHHPSRRGGELEHDVDRAQGPRFHHDAALDQRLAKRR